MDKRIYLFNAFSDVMRLRILNLLLKHCLCVCELRQLLNVPPPTISRHLAYLRRAGLVNVSTHGRWAFYALAPSRSHAHDILMRCAKKFFEEAGFLRRDLKRIGRMKPMLCD